MTEVPLGRKHRSGWTGDEQMTTRVHHGRQISDGGGPVVQMLDDFAAQHEIELPIDPFPLDIERLELGPRHPLGVAGDRLTREIRTPQRACVGKRRPDPQQHLTGAAPHVEHRLECNAAEYSPDEPAAVPRARVEADEVAELTPLLVVGLARRRYSHRALTSSVRPAT